MTDQPFQPSAANPQVDGSGSGHAGQNPEAAFASRWHGMVAAWTGAQPGQSTFPALTGKHKALLKQIEPLAQTGSIVVLGTQSKWTRDEIEASLAESIRQALRTYMGFEAILSFTEAPTEPATGPATEPTTPATETATQPPATAPTELPAEPPQAQLNDPADRARAHAEDVATGYTVGNFRVPPQPPVNVGPTLTRAMGDSLSKASLNPLYTFENFVTGSSNQLAYAACRAVSEYPGQAYNPLLIWGESGLGKTHLLHAIGHYALELRPELKIKYVSSEELTNDFINSIATDTREAFKRRYRSLDMLIVDDTQFLQGKESTQEEFFHTFNALHQAGKQIVLSSDRPPRQLTTLEDRLRTRFESGLITDVQSPELETRMAILETKATSQNVDLPADVKHLIASRYEGSIRELEGALIRVLAYCSLGHEPLSLQAAEVALRDILPSDAHARITPELIIDCVAEFFQVTTDELVGKGRAKQIASARQIAMYLCREMTELSLPKLGATFGGRDHTTVMYAERRIHDALQEDPKVFNQVQELTQNIKMRARS